MHTALCKVWQITVIYVFPHYIIYYIAIMHICIVATILTYGLHELKGNVICIYGKRKCNVLSVLQGSLAKLIRFMIILRI